MIGVIRQLSVNLLRNALLTIYKSFIRPHLHCDGILYEKPSNDNFQNKMFNKKTLAQEISLFYKILNRLLPDYLPLFLSRLPFSRKLFTKIIISLYYKTTSNKNKTLQKNIFSILYKQME